MVDGRIPVARAKSACVQRTSPSLRDSKIFIICSRSFCDNLPDKRVLVWIPLDYHESGYSKNNAGDNKPPALCLVWKQRIKQSEPGGRNNNHGIRVRLALFWQRMRDSNPRKRSQSPVCYRYTNPLFGNHDYYTHFFSFVNMEKRYMSMCTNFLKCAMGYCNNDNKCAMMKPIGGKIKRFRGKNRNTSNERGWVD